MLQRVREHNVFFLPLEVIEGHQRWLLLVVSLNSVSISRDLPASKEVPEGKNLSFIFSLEKTEAVPRKLTEIAGKQVSEIQAALDLDKI